MLPIFCNPLPPPRPLVTGDSKRPTANFEDKDENKDVGEDEDRMMMMMMMMMIIMKIMMMKMMMMKMMMMIYLYFFFFRGWGFVQKLDIFTESAPLG